MELVLGEVQSNAKGGKYLPIKGKDGCNNPTFRSTQWAAVVWEPSAYAAEGDRVNVCLEATEELAEAVLRWETAAAGLATKHAASMFGKAQSQAQMQERLQSCLKTSAQGLKFLKLKATMRNLGLGGKAGQGARQPARAKGPGGGAAAAALGDEPAVRAGSGGKARPATSQNGPPALPPPFPFGAG